MGIQLPLAIWPAPIKWSTAYQEIDDKCIAIKTPKNGYYSDSPSWPGWKCERGYRHVNEACVQVKLPTNAHLNHSGNDWECNRPYQRRQRKCVIN